MTKITGSSRRQKHRRMTAHWLLQEPFTYTAKGKTITISNWKLPIDELEDPDRMKEWVDKSYRVAMKAKNRRV